MLYNDIFYVQTEKSQTSLRTHYSSIDCPDCHTSSIHISVSLHVKYNVGTPHRRIAIRRE